MSWRAEDVSRQRQLGEDERCGQRRLAVRPNGHRRRLPWPKRRPIDSHSQVLAKGPRALMLREHCWGVCLQFSSGGILDSF